MPKTILVVDDEKDIVEMLRYNLEKEGFKVITASNGLKALEQAERKPNLIILDVMMPEMDGWQVFKELKRNQKTESIPVMFLTARGTETDEIVGLELGADDFLAKPVRIKTLVARIRNNPMRFPSGNWRSMFRNTPSLSPGKKRSFPRKNLKPCYSWSAIKAR